MVFGTQTLGFNVLSDGFQPLKNIKLTAESDGDPGAQDAAQPLFNDGYTCNNQPNPRSTILVPWDTVMETPHNGKYEIVVTVETYSNPTCGGTGRTGTATRHSIVVDNAPDPVDAPKILATTPSTVTIQWDASTAPDVTHYEVLRAIGTSARVAPPPEAFHFLAFSTSPTYRDTQVSGGNVFWYAIIVNRRSVWPADKGEISSPMSGSSQAVSIAAATPPPSFNNGSADSSVQRYVPLNPILLGSGNSGVSAPVPDAPYSAQLPYGNAPEQGGVGASTNNKANEAGATDPRGPVLPVAVGAFLVSAALALGRMPY